MRQFIKTRLRRALVALPVSAALVVVLLPASGCGRKPAAAPAPSRPAAAAPAPRVPTGSEVFASATTSLTTSLESARRALSHGSTDATAIAAVRGFAASLPELDKGVQADFAKTRGILAKVKSKEKDAIESRVERTYAKRKDALAKRLAAVTSAESTSALKTAIASTADYLDSITPDEPYQPLGTSLPHRIVDAHAGPPALGTRIAPAYAPNTPGATPSTLPVTPTAADTTQTVEVQFSPEITALVASLGSDPVRMYEYVRNAIDFEPYYGSRKGATETLLEGSGNDIDTASLLIALYRAAGIPARYVSGVVDVPIAKAMNWVGVETPEAAAKLFSAGGTPTKLIISGGRPKTLQIEHTWAEVYVAYEDYRGTGEGSGEKIWVPLDGSYKEYRHTKPAYLAAMSDVPTWLAGSEDVTAVAGELSREFLNAEGAVESMPGATNGNAFGAIAIQPRALGLLPSALAFGGSVTGERASLEAGLGWHVGFDFDGDGHSELTTAMPSLAGRQVTIEFAPADASDVDVIEACGSLADAPAWAIHMMPLLTIDGAVLATGSVVGLGEPSKVAVTFAMPGGVEDARVKMMSAGSMHAVIINPGRPAPAAWKRTADLMHVTGAALASQEETTIPTERYLGTLLRGTGLSYFAMCAALRRYTTFGMNVVAFEEPQLAFCGMDMQVSRVLGAPAAADAVGLQFDVKRDVFNCIERSDNRLQRRTWMFLDGLLGSSGEHVVFEGLLGERAVSTQRLLRIAGDQGVPIHRMSGSEGAATAATLDLPSDARAAILARLAAGGSVIAPAREIAVGDWSGVGWIELDDDGDSGFMISGGLAGGSSVDTGKGMASVEDDGTPTPTPGAAPTWAGGHPTVSDVLFDGFIGRLAEYTRQSTPDRYSGSGYRGPTGYVSRAFVAEEEAKIQALGSLAMVASGLWNAVWEIIESTAGSTSANYLSNDKILRRAILSFAVGVVSSAASVVAAYALAEFNEEWARGAPIAGLALGAVINFGWSNIKWSVFQALQLGPEPRWPNELRQPRFADEDYRLPDLSDPARSIEDITTPTFH